MEGLANIIQIIQKLATWKQTIILKTGAHYSSVLMTFHWTNG